MTINQLEVFCAVAARRSFSLAAKAVNLSQPAVSLQVQSLEEHYGTRLFDRSVNSISLTPMGEILYQHARNILSIWEQADREIRDHIGSMEGEVMVGASTTVGQYVLPRVIGNFQRKFPLAVVRLQVNNTAEIIRLLTENILDLGLLEASVDNKKLACDALTTDRIVLIIGTEHPWAGREYVVAAELRGEPLILREPGSGTRRVVERALRDANLRMEDFGRVMELGSTEAIKTAVESGLGIAFVSQWAVRKELQLGSLKVIPVRDLLIERSFCVAYPRQKFKSRMAEEFVSFAKKQV